MIALQPSLVTTTRPAAPSMRRLAGTRLGDCHLLTSDERDALERAVTSATTLRPNVDLVHEGKRADSLFVLTQGWACRYTTTRNGARHVSALLLPGDVVNLDTLMFERSDYSVRTLTRASVVALPRDRGLALAAEHIGIARTFTWLALVENAILSRWSLSLGRRGAKERLAHLLCELSVRLRVRGDSKRSFALPLTQEQIADAIGLTAVHVNRMVRDLRQEGLMLMANGTVTLPDVSGLSRLAGFEPGYLHMDAHQS